VSTKTIERTAKKKKQTTDNEIENIKTSLRCSGGGGSAGVGREMLRREQYSDGPPWRRGAGVLDGAWGGGTLVAGTVSFGGGEGRYPLFLHRWQAALSQLVPGKYARTTAVHYRDRRRRRPYPIAKARASACRMYIGADTASRSPQGRRP